MTEDSFTEVRQGLQDSSWNEPTHTTKVTVRIMAWIAGKIKSKLAILQAQRSSWICLGSHSMGDDKVIEESGFFFFPQAPM